jgi:hypothetical protein
LLVGQGIRSSRTTNLDEFVEVMVIVGRWGNHQTPVLRD